MVKSGLHSNYRLSAVVKVGPSRFERESPAPQAGRIPSYPTGPKREIMRNDRALSVGSDLVD
jgi:hypothetical protein